MFIQMQKYDEAKELIMELTKEISSGKSGVPARAQGMMLDLLDARRALSEQVRMSPMRGKIGIVK